MPRTIEEWKVPSTSIEEISSTIKVWLSRNQFEILEWYSGGSWIDYNKLGFRMSLRPKPGSIVAVSYRISGTVVFEISLSKENDDTIIHGEFYAIGGGPLAGKEFDFCPTLPSLDQLARKRGYTLMANFEKSLSLMSAKRTVATDERIKNKAKII